MYVLIIIIIKLLQIVVYSSDVIYVHVLFCIYKIQCIDSLSIFWISLFVILITHTLWPVSHNSGQAIKSN